MCSRSVSLFRVARAGRRPAAAWPARSIGSPARALAVALALGAAASLAAPARAAERFQFKAEPAEVRADERGMWAVLLTLVNQEDLGLYPDSMRVLWKSEATADRPASEGSQDYSRVAIGAGPTGAGETRDLQLSLPSEFERGSLTVRMWLHDAKGGKFQADASVKVVGSELADRNPSELLDAGARKVEVVVMRPDSAAWPAAALVLLPESGTRARSMLRWGLRFTDLGIAVAIVSPPGAGASAGPDDRAGPASVAAAKAALARVRRDPACTGRPVQFWGEREGATTALLAASGEPKLGGVVAIDASYDPWADYRAMSAEQKSAYTAAAGRDSSAWRARSPLEVASRIEAPVIVLNTEAGGAPATALEFASRRSAQGLGTESRIHGTDARGVRRADAWRFGINFVTRHTQAKSP